MNQTATQEPTLLSAMWRYRFIVLGSVIAAVTLGYFGANLRPPQYQASAGLAVEDPIRSDIFGSSRFISPDRYVINQVEILRSDVVAQRAIEIASKSEPSVALDPQTISVRTTIKFDSDSDFIQIRFRASDPAIAQAGANAVAQAYQDVVQSEVDQSKAALLDQLDSSVAEIDADLLALRQEITAELQSDESNALLDQRVDELVNQLLSLNVPQAGQDELNTIEFIVQELRARQLVRDLESVTPEIAPLLQQQTALSEVRDSLTLRRGEISSIAALPGAGVTLFSPAGPGRTTGVGTLLVLEVSLALGLLAGAGAAYFLSLRKLEFGERHEPQRVLQAPLIGALPRFGKIDGKTVNLPVLAEPESPRAEAVRFIAATLTAPSRAQLTRVGSDLLSVGSVAVISSHQGEGKSTVISNVAIAAANQGRRVLVIDADFGGQGASSVLMPGPPVQGLTEVVNRRLSLDAAATQIDLQGRGDLRVLSRGLLPVTAPDFFDSPQTRDFFEEVKHEFDLVLIDTPPLLGIAYAGTLISCVDRVLAVIPHRSLIGSAAELRERLDLIGTEIAGYVYNGGPHAGPEHGEGSMADVLGVANLAVQYQYSEPKQTVLG